MTKPKPTRKPSGALPQQTPAAPADDGKTLRVTSEPGKTEARQFADLVSRGIATNGITAAAFTGSQLGAVSITEMVASLQDAGEAVNRGDLSNAERVLNAQALTLNAMFSELARRSALNMGEHLGAAETYMRLALKAQSQSRATFETLAAIKNPPVVYARQANINNGGQQQVNNAPAPSSKPVSAHAGQTVFQPNELLEDRSDGRTQLDIGATATAGRTHQEVEAVGAIHRAAQR